MLHPCTSHCAGINARARFTRWCGAQPQHYGWRGAKMAAAPKSSPTSGYGGPGAAGQSGSGTCTCHIECKQGSAGGAAHGRTCCRGVRRARWVQYAKQCTVCALLPSAPADHVNEVAHKGCAVACSLQTNALAPSGLDVVPACQGASRVLLYVWERAHSLAIPPWHGDQESGNARAELTTRSAMLLWVGYSKI